MPVVSFGPVTPALASGLSWWGPEAREEGPYPRPPTSPGPSSLCLTLCVVKEMTSVCFQLTHM